MEEKPRTDRSLPACRMDSREGDEKERMGYLYSHIPKGSNSSAHVLFCFDIHITQCPTGMRKEIKNNGTFLSLFLFFPEKGLSFSFRSTLQKLPSIIVTFPASPFFTKYHSPHSDFRSHIHPIPYHTNRPASMKVLQSVNSSILPYKWGIRLDTRSHISFWGGGGG